MIRFILTTHDEVPGYRLSKPGHWANEPFNTEAEARACAKDSASGHPYTIEREHWPRPPFKQRK